jgi:hypothetical protein
VIVGAGVFGAAAGGADARGSGVGCKFDVEPALGATKVGGGAAAPAEQVEQPGC